MSVQKAWKREDDGRYVVGTPKTERGRRTMGLSDELAKTIAPVVTQAKAGEPVFTTVRGGKLTSSAFYNCVWKDVIDRAEEKGCGSGRDSTIYGPRSRRGCSQKV